VAVFMDSLVAVLGFEPSLQQFSDDPINLLE
jgi:hypothetical protein